MGTQALIELRAPIPGDGELRIRVHYDGGADTRDALKALIARDGHGHVWQVFAAQRSKFWVGLNPTMTVRPDYVDTYPADWTVDVVPGYGLIFVGDREIQASTEPNLFDWECWESSKWLVTADGRVR